MSLRYRLYPTDKQVETMRMHCGHARFVWNLAVEQVSFAGSLGCYPDQRTWNRQLAEARKAVAWLAEGSSSVQQGALRDLRQAFRNWWGNPKHFGPPKFRSRHRGNEGFVVRDLKLRKVNRRWAEVHVPKAGWVRFRLSRPWGKHKSARVTLDKAGRWHVSLVGPQPQFDREPTGAVVGVDRGVTDTVATSDGWLTSPSGLTADELARKKRLQRKLARQKPGSKRRERTRTAIAKLSARATDRRKDWVEKTSTALVRDYDVIVFEDLKIRNMMASASGTVDQPGVNVAAKRGLNRAISEQGWAMLRRRVEDKASTCGVEVVGVPAPFTSQTCSLCGGRGQRSGKVFICVHCDLTADADVNAAENIRAAGLVVLGRGAADSSRGDEPPNTQKGKDLRK